MSTRALLNLLTPFEMALADPRTTEVVVNECGAFGVEAGEWSWQKDDRLPFSVLDAIGILAAYESSQDLSPTNPLVGSTLPGGERIQICRPPATLPGVITITIRKPSERTMRIDDDDFGGLFQETNTGNTRSSIVDELLATLYHRRDWGEFFKLAVKQKKTIGVCGATGSGKTTLLKRFLMEIPQSDRVVTIEDTAEFGNAGPPNRVNLFYGDGRANLTAEAVLKATLRMRPDRIIMQEVRGAEAFGFLRALASGHSGATSWHAEEGHEWDALELMMKQSAAGAGIPETALRGYLRQYIDCLVYCVRDDRGFSTPRVWFKGVEP